MKKLIVALALCCMAAPAFADKPAPPPVHHKKHKKVTVVTPPVEAPPVVVPPVETPTPPPPVVVAPPPPAVVVPPPVVKLPPKVVCLKAKCPDYENQVVIPSAHLAVGVGVQEPWASGLLGLRLEFPKAYLGLEPFVSIPYGAGVDGMVYAYRGKVVQFYPLSVGFMLNWNYNQSTGAFGTHDRFLSVQDVNRLIDLRVGAGVQVKLACHVLLALDWRANIPDPVKLARENGVCHNCGGAGSRALDAGAVVGNAFAQSQLYLGILIR